MMMRKRVIGIIEASNVQMLILTTKQLFPPKCEYGLDRVRSPDGEAAGWTPARNYTRAEQFKAATDISERFCHNLTFGYHTSIRNKTISDGGITVDFWIIKVQLIIK